MAKVVHWLMPWDLNEQLPWARDIQDGHVVLYIRSDDHMQAMPFHRQRVALVHSAVDHFIEHMRSQGHEVITMQATGYVQGLRAFIEEHKPERVVAMKPREWAVSKALHDALGEGALPPIFTFHDDGGEGSHFLLSRDDFRRWARNRKTYRMHHFYAWMRKRTGWLMEDGKPLGGKMSFDTSNREHAKGHQPPAVPQHRTDAITQEHLDRASNEESLWGNVESFNWPVTREQALEEMEHFFDKRAQRFGAFQDAMLGGEVWMWHSRLAAAMNLGLLGAKEVCERILRAHSDGAMPIESAEGMLRQILGWREYVRAIYWIRMPHMREANTLRASHDLPTHFWEPNDLNMTCLKRAIEHVRDHAYAHHIERLMVLGNFALLVGVKPLQLSHWFWSAFADAWEWVELPNVHGMALYADDTMTTKPYAASASYIHKMSDHCDHCTFDPRARTGDNACPFNYLFWDFMAEHEQTLEGIPRLKMLLSTWHRFDESEKKSIRAHATHFRKRLPILGDQDTPYTFRDDAC